jgi:hypothetical protein
MILSTRTWTSVKRLLLGLALAYQFSCIPQTKSTGGSSDQTKGGPALNLPPDPGILVSPDSTGLTRLPNQPLFNLERVYKIIEGPRSTVEVPIDAAVAFEGWAVDSDAHSRAGGVNVVVDGKHYPARYGISRFDVASHFAVADYAYSGFSCSVLAAKIGKGDHTVTLHVISRDRKSYAEGWPVTLRVQ